MSAQDSKGLVSGYDEGQAAATVVVVKWSAGLGWAGWGLVTTLSDIITMPPPPPPAAVHYQEHYCY